MLKEYIKKTHCSLPFFRLLLVNIPFSAFNLIFFIVLPLLLRRHYIIEESLASLIKITFFFCLELLILPTAKSIQLGRIKSYNIQSMHSILLSSFFYALFKTSIFVLHLFLFRLCFAWNKLFAFLVLFSFFFLWLTSYYLPPIIIEKKTVSNKQNMKMLAISSFKESFVFFASHPFFTFLIFIHSLFLLSLSPLTLFFYPSLSHIMYNIEVAYQIIISVSKHRIEF